MTKPLPHILRDELIRLEYGSTQLRDVSDASWAAAAELIEDLVLVKERRGGPFVMTVSVDADLREFIRVRKDVNWSAVAREAFRRELERLDRLDKLHRLKCPGCGRLRRVDLMSVPCARCGKTAPETSEE